MKRAASLIAYILVLLNLCAPAAAFEVKGDTIKLDPQEVLTCLMNGGCAPVPKLALAKQMAEHGERNFQAGAEYGYRLGFDAGMAEAKRMKDRAL